MSGRWQAVGRALAVAIVSGVLSAACHRTAELAGNAQIDALFAQWDKPDSPGCGVGVSRNGAVVFEHGYGLARLEGRQPITTATVFDVASISKQFTAMSVLLLAADGKIAIDREIWNYVPEWVDRTDRVTVRHLLAHTAGMRDAFLLTELAAPPRPDEDINDRLFRILARQRGLNFAPGSQFSYNNGAYNLLGGLVKRLSGQPLAAFAEARLFKPLGLTDTAFPHVGMPVAAQRAFGYHQDDSGTFQEMHRGQVDTPPVVGNAGLTSTVRDLLRWEQNFAEPRVGSAAIVDAMQTPATLGDGSKSPYGLGLEVGEDRGLTTVGHGGGDRGIAAYVIRYPQRALAVAVLCNLDNVGFGVGGLARQVAGLYLENDRPASTPGPEPPKSVVVSEASLLKMAGLYRDVLTGTHSRIFVRGGTLMASADAGDGLGDSVPLTPIGAERFALAGTPIVAEFVPGAPGRPDRFQVAGDGPSLRISERVETRFTPTPTDLRAFAGPYTSSDLDVVYTLVVRDNRLIIQTPGRPDIELAPVFPDAFYGSLVDLIRFSRDSRGAITGFAINRVSVRNLRFDRLH